MEGLWEITQILTTQVEIGEDYKGDTDKMLYESGGAGWERQGCLRGEEACEIGLHGWMRFISVASLLLFRVTFFHSPTS